MQDLVDRLRTRFPLLAHACLHQQGTADAIEALPPFLGLFMAAMAAPATTPLCFILPRRGDIARLAAVIHGLQQFSAAVAEGEARPTVPIPSTGAATTPSMRVCNREHR